MPDFWIGGNSYYLHSYNQQPRLQVLDAMQSVGMKTVRLFIADIYANNKGSDSRAVPDGALSCGLPGDAR
jgi:mannan endo-1,4-beta-mannosidase